LENEKARKINSPFIPLLSKKGKARFVFSPFSKRGIEGD
jgi:hypothetical protein